MSEQDDDDGYPDFGEPYDFSDWQLGDTTEMLEGIVRDHLRQAFTEFGNGHWRCMDHCIYWEGSTGDGWEDRQPAQISITPTKFANAVIEELTNLHSPYEMDDLAALSQKITEGWHAAIERIQAETRRMIENPPPPPPSPEEVLARAVEARKHIEAVQAQPISWMPPRDAFAIYNHGTGEVTFDWEEIGRLADDPGHNQPIAKLLLAARAAGGAGFS